MFTQFLGGKRCPLLPVMARLRTDFPFPPITLARLATRLDNVTGRWFRRVAGVLPGLGQFRFQRSDLFSQRSDLRGQIRALSTSVL